MGREVKRVPLDFDWPIDKIWEGYTLDEPQDPPEGDGYQMWETVSEGSPMSPVFKTPEELAHWLTDNEASASGNRTATYDQWLKMIGMGWAPSMIFTPATGLVSGVEGF